MNRILVPTDFSKFAQYATKMAFVLAQAETAEIHFVHLMDVPVGWINVPEADQKKIYPDITKRFKEVNIKLDNLMADANKAGLEAKKYIQFNTNFKYLIEHIEELKCDFVVMGSHGISGFTEFLLGSNAQKVVRYSPVPVLVMKKPLAEDAIGDIVFASDFESESTEGFKKVVEFALTQQVKIHLLYINTPSNFTETALSDVIMEHYVAKSKGTIAGTWVYNCFKFEEGLAQFMDKHHGVLAMVTHDSKNGLTESVINHLDIPVLSVPN